MGTMRTLVVAAVGVLLLGLSHGALAQQPAQPQADVAQAQGMENIQLTREAIQAERQTLVTMAMDLTPEEMQAFWPLYREYRLAASMVGDRIVALVQLYAEHYDDLTDAAADTLVTEFVAIEQMRAALKATYLPKFKQILPARKVARFYQIDNKMDIVILAAMAREIPLAR